ncbi:MAG: hypothetical protein N2515_01665, partial [Deltaproteobacteria bacterium]|nr:hypothetical protein [Deltaproteobacteria bacterium]
MAKGLCRTWHSGFRLGMALEKAKHLWRKKPLIGTLLVWTLILGCADYERFRTDEEHVFRGTVIGEGAASFIRRGFPAGSRMELEFDPNAIGQPVVGAFRVISPDGSMFIGQTPLESVAALAHDALSELVIPGASR